LKSSTSGENVVLVGLMGAGKTTIGRGLAKRLGWSFVDSDHEIQERTGVSIPTIFEIEGETGFRRREAAVIADLMQRDRIVLATGGGAVLDAENRKCIGHATLVAYLCTPPEILFARTRHDRNRPILQVDDPLAKLKALLVERDPLYREVADLVIDGENCTQAQIVQQLEKEVKSRCVL
jgi:shikimate kinase